MKEIKKGIADGRYFFVIKYAASPSHAFGVKVSIVVHDCGAGTNIALFDNSHRTTEGVWPPHLHTDKARHFYLNPAVAQGKPGDLVRGGIAIVIDHISKNEALVDDDKNTISAALILAWLQIRRDENWP